MFFSEVGEARPDAVFGLGAAFAADVRSEKVNLLIGIYKDEQLKAELFPSVRRAQEKVLDVKADYLPFDGMEELVDGLGLLIFGKGPKERIYGAQAIGGTGALRLGAEFLAQEVGKRVYVPYPTWPNHRGIFEKVGFQVEDYPWYREKRFDFEGVVDALEKMSERSIVLFHGCCHNPTGCDPDEGQWREIAACMKRRKLLPFFDFAYQGLGDGVEEDARAIRSFCEQGHEMLVAYSCSKNFSMYCQRVGALFVVNENEITQKKVGSQVRKIIRTLYSNPPAFGAKVVAEVLKKREEWEKDLAAVRNRLGRMRRQFVETLISRSKGTNFQYLKHHKGMFSYIGLDKSQVQKLIDQYAIYLQDNGRINVAGLTDKNLDYVVNSLINVIS